jgi:ribosome-associated protein
VTATTHTVELVRIAAEAAADKLADAIIGYDVSEQLVITDVFLLCSARNDRQVRSIVDEIEERLQRAAAKPIRREGEREGRWVLLDYVDFVVHVQLEEERVFYALERLWKDCPRIPLPEPVTAGVDGGSRVDGGPRVGGGSRVDGGSRVGGGPRVGGGALPGGASEAGEER